MGVKFAIFDSHCPRDRTGLIDFSAGAGGGNLSAANVNERRTAINNRASRIDMRSGKDSGMRSSGIEYPHLLRRRHEGRQ